MKNLVKTTKENECLVNGIIRLSICAKDLLGKGFLPFEEAIDFLRNYLLPGKSFRQRIENARKKCNDARAPEWLSETGEINDSAEFLKMFTMIIEIDENIKDVLNISLKTGDFSLLGVSSIRKSLDKLNELITCSPEI